MQGQFLKKKIHLLSQISFLEALSDQEIGWFGQRIPDTHLAQGQILYTPRYESKLVFLLLEGRMRLYKAIQGQELTLEVINAGTMFGEAAFTNQRQGAYAEALEQSWVGFVSLNILGELMRMDAEVGLKVAALLSKRSCLYASQIADIGLKEVPARLASLVLRLCQSEGVVTSEGYRIPTRYTHEQLATMIGAKRVAVTRAFANLMDAGAVELRRRIIYIKDLEALKHIAGPW